MTTYNVSNFNNWQSVWNGSFTASPAPGNRPELERYFPLPEISVPIQLNAKLLAFYATSQGADPKWKFAAHVKRKYATGLTVGGNPDAVVDSKRIWFFRTYTVENSSSSRSAQQCSKVDKYQSDKNSKP